MSEASSFRPLATCLHINIQTTQGAGFTAPYTWHSFCYKRHYGPHRAEVGLATGYTDLHEWTGQGESQSYCSKALGVLLGPSFPFCVA